MARLIQHKGSFCICGCGDYAKPGRKYILGHARKCRIHPIVILNHHPCRCGCGMLIASNKRYTSGHNKKGTHPTEETLKKLRKPRSEEAKKNMRRPKTEQGRKNIRDAANRPEEKERRAQRTRDIWQDPKLREKKLKALAVTRANQEVQERRIASCKIAQNRPEVRLANSEVQKIV